MSALPCSTTHAPMTRSTRGPDRHEFPNDLIVLLAGVVAMRALRRAGRGAWAVADLAFLAHY
jgi:hypothetical protein